MATAKKKDNEPTVIKKYANRRLYDTGRSSYVTLDDLCIMVKEGHDFVVYDAKTGEDLTRQVLTQIIVDQEAKGENMLPISFLRQFIGFYGDSLQSLVPDYLEQSFETFTKNQEQFREQVNKSLGGMGMMNPATAMEEMTRQNMAMFENAMRAWTPFAMGGKDAEERMKALKDNIEAMQKELSRLSGL
ncbi:MAG: polyhydroxyalkanoate synthesis repressor PhaR [Rhodospirillales bacterium]|nr:polyhydroxyalkanoate synthesis repressor PhaR [Rhodospirillales bacterium]MCB9995466.1 polyhydroxyalkanoate synthesis repressor PhaR [Rhodospirillales bacterium]